MKLHDEWKTLESNPDTDASIFSGEKRRENNHVMQLRHVVDIIHS